MSEAETRRLMELAEKGDANPASLSIEERRDLCALTLKRLNKIN